MDHRRRVKVVPAAIVVVLGLVTAACGGSSDKTSSTAPSSSASPSTTAASTSTTTPAAQTARLMKAGLVRASDVPSTWKDSGEASDSGSNEEQIALAKTIAACRAFAETVARENEQPKVSSNKFVDSTASPDLQGQVSNEVVSWPSVADAEAAYRVYSAGSMTSCLDALFRKLVLQELTGSGVEVTVAVEDLPVPAVGDDAVGYEAIVTLTGATSQQIAFIVEIVRVANFTVSYNATMYAAAPTDFGKNLVGRSVGRLVAASSS